MGLDVDDAALKALQADNFDNLNEVVAGSPFDRHMRFFNFGYRPLGDEEPVGPHLGAGFPNRDSAQLLFQVIGDTDLDGADVAEVGCGRGGNLWLARRSFAPATVTGLDIAFRSIAYCAAAMPEPEARFAVADAERLPLAAASCDVVLSVETSCTYPRIEAFFREVARVLRRWPLPLHRPHGRRPRRAVQGGDRRARPGAGPRARHHGQRVRVPRRSRRPAAARLWRAARRRHRRHARKYVGESGSRLYELLTNDEYRYTILRFRKVADVVPPAHDLLSAEAQRAVRDLAELAVELLTIPSLPPAR